MKALELPRLGDFTSAAIERWLANIPRELAMPFLDSEEVRYVRDYYEEAGLLRAWRRPFFLRHFADTISAAAAHLLRGASQPVILDLGCGTGSQALFFALQGARVVGVDMDETALRIFRKRVELYSALAGRELPVTIINGNVFEIDYAAYGPFSGVYSLFAFNMMQPSGELLERLRPHFSSSQVRWAVLDGNQSSLWCRVVPGLRRSAWTPPEMRRALEQLGFVVVSQRGGVTLPPICWAVVPRRLARAVDAACGKTIILPISCQTLATLDSGNLTRIA